MDSIIVRSYNENSNFTILKDSFLTNGVYADYDSEKLVIEFSNGVSFDLDYKIDVLSTGKSYSITGLEKGSKECNSCLPWGHDYYSVLDKYYLNDLEKYSNGSGIKIQR